MDEAGRALSSIWLSFWRLSLHTGRIFRRHLMKQQKVMVCRLQLFHFLCCTHPTPHCVSQVPYLERVDMWAIRHLIHTNIANKNYTMWRKLVSERYHCGAGPLQEKSWTKWSKLVAEITDLNFDNKQAWNNWANTNLGWKLIPKTFRSNKDRFLNFLWPWVQTLTTHCDVNVTYR